MSVLSFIGIIKENLERDVNLSRQQKAEISKKLKELSEREVNILVIGGTGVGKSSTINALFKVDRSEKAKNDQAKVGFGPNPETQEITRYIIGHNMIVWDSPGIGESPRADVRHARLINKKLREKKSAEEDFIDAVLIVLDGASRDYAQTFKLINNLGLVQKKNRIVVGINRIDMLLQGEGWDAQHNIPSEPLKKTIQRKVQIVARQLKKECGLDIDPVPYCAGRAEDGFGAAEPYEISELLCRILLAVPEEKRVAVIEKTQSKVLRSSSRKQKKVIESSTQSTLSSVLPRVLLGVLTGGIFGGCFITSAVAAYKNKPDNCHMLYAFRKFRDHWLLRQEDGPSLVSEYYEMAPGIVQWIERQENRNNIYEYIYVVYLSKCYKLIKHRKYKACKRLYVRMVEDLANKRCAEKHT